MADPRLKDQPILVVEDEYMLAQDLCDALCLAGAAVVGPAASVEDAGRLLESRIPIVAAVLDVSLRGQPVYPVADLLTAR